MKEFLKTSMNHFNVRVEMDRGRAFRGSNNVKSIWKSHGDLTFNKCVVFFKIICYTLYILQIYSVILKKINLSKSKQKYKKCIINKNEQFQHI